MKHSLLKIYTTVFIAVGLLILSFGAGWYVAKENGENTQGQSGSVFSLHKHQNVDLSLFWNVWDLLDAKFVPTHGTSTAMTDQERIYAAIEGLTDSYGDPYTVFFPPVESKSFAEDVSGNFQGVGMEIGIRDNVLTVVAPLKDSPAEKAGILSGDRIVEVDGQSMAGFSAEEAVEIIRGEKGTEVTLTIRRESVREAFQVPITRDEIHIPAIDTELTEDNIFVIRLYSFSAVSINQFREALREFIKAETDKLVLDLRGNPGGYLDAAIDMASWFLPEGKVIVREDYNGEAEEDAYRSKGYDIFTDELKFVILVDGGSAADEP